MRAAFYERTGPAHDVLRIGDLLVPEAGPGEALVKVAASGINPHDTKARSGWTGRPLPAPRVTPHSDGAGTIVTVGEGVPADTQPGVVEQERYVEVPLLGRRMGVELSSEREERRPPRVGGGACVREGPCQPALDLVARS